MSDDVITHEPQTDANWYDEDTATFGDRMAGAREAANMGQAELARRMGVKAKTIRAWENDQAEPRANKLQMLAGVLGVSIMWLLTGRGDGIDGPFEASALSEDTSAILKDLRRIRAEQAQLSEALGRLEKRLRQTLVQEAGGQ